MAKAYKRLRRQRTQRRLKNQSYMEPSKLRRAAPGLRFNEHLDEEDGPFVFAHACKMGLEGIVSKRKDSAYCSGQSTSPRFRHKSSPTIRRNLPR